MEIKREIRPLTAEEIIPALDLCWVVFSEFVAPGYSQEGIDEFWAFLDHEYMLYRFGEGVVKFWGAFIDDQLIGVAMMQNLCHISLLYVLGDYHRQGVATNLIKKAILDCKQVDEELSKITVNSSPYAVPFYLSMGFAPKADLQETDGIRYVPMAIEA